MNEIVDPNQWNEAASQKFIDLADIFVPGRAEQSAALVHLIPARADEVFTIVELASGAGTLAHAILEQFPRCRYVALDASETMRAQIAITLAEFSDRLEIRSFALSDQTWRQTLPAPLRCVLSSLSVHHLPGDDKRQLFNDIAAHLEPGGALLLADIIEPATPHIAALYAQQYDTIVREQSLAIRGDLSGYAQFQELRWNYFSYDYGTSDTYDYPSLLSDQLLWLREASFTTVDCFWLRAGHAVYGGYR